MAEGPSLRAQVAIFGRLSEERQKQAVRMLASNIKYVADETFNIEVKASSVETSMRALGITPDMFPMDPGTPVEVGCDQAVAALAAIIKPSQQSESLVKVSDIAAKTAALGPQVWEAATTGSSAAYCKQLIAWLRVQTHAGQDGGPRGVSVARSHAGIVPVGGQAGTRTPGPVFPNLTRVIII